MSEKLHQPKGHEHAAVNPEASAEARRNLERIHKDAEKEARHGNNAEHLQTQVKERAISGKEITIGEKESAPSPMGVQRELKSESYKHTLRHIRAKLKGTDKVLSRIVHQPAVEKMSNIGANTVARPSGVLGGGFVALIGSSLLLYLARHYGFEYSFTAFFLLFLGGFVIGVVLEGLIKLFRRKRSV